MPYKSKAQQKYLRANKPKLAAKWSKKYPQDVRKLPAKVKPKK